ncbi:hypothetical protein MPSEU_000123400 [Mayamaea pseudoterrestris]|nr:hypothetical protein MPSEU_000123400 [Mayamaea pseudoterrestris]
MMVTILLRLPLLLTALLLLLVAAHGQSESTVSAAGSSSDGISDTTNTDNSECGLYLAVSSTSTDDNTIWGIYAGKHYAEGETVGVPELAVNTHNLRFNVVSLRHPPQTSLIKSLGFLEENFWVGELVGAKYELSKGRSISLVSGSGSLGAASPKATNANWHQQKTWQRQPLGEQAGVAHPSRGAISPFYDAVLRTLTPVKAGSEIFVDYGNTFDEKSEDGEDELTKDDYLKLDETVQQMIHFFDKHRAELDPDSKREIYSFITKNVMTAAVGATKALKIAAMLPPSADELADVVSAGGVLQYVAPTSSQPTAWLQEHGKCMDNLRAGASTIVNAGRGAFATRHIKQASTIVPVPLLQIPNKSILNIYPLKPNSSGELSRINDTVTGTQLLMNYCFGHPDSTMLLAPTGSNVGLINHHETPNAKLVWSNHTLHEKHWLQLPPEQLVTNDYAYVGLVLEVVALRDIAQGEEVFLDYGVEWVEAWNKHEQVWQERLASGDLPSKWPLRALDMNAAYANKPFLTKEELARSPYPKNVGLAVFLMLANDGASGTIDDPKTWTAPASNLAFTWEYLVEPDFIESVATNADGSFSYTIKWTKDENEAFYVKDVPHSAFVFVDASETSDQFTKDPFRHYISIPDDVFPQVNAGRGAFATRHIKQASTIVPVPLLQIPNKSILNIYPLKPNSSGELSRINDTVTGTQLLMNYCFGHPDSTMLLAPTGSNVGLINHHETPNAKLVWSNHTLHEKHWLQLPPEQLVTNDYAYVGLVLEVVALRDIAQGEEVFLDYGVEWVEAWNKHEQVWQERLASGDLPSKWPLRALDMNAAYANKPFLTKEELARSPYPKNVGLAVFLMLANDGASGTIDDPKTWTAPASNLAFTWEYLVEPDFIESVATNADGSFSYTIKWTKDENEAFYVKDVPHSAFVFVDASETSDQFTKDPFRHYIQIPDDVFPQGPWRNTKKQ